MGDTEREELEALTVDHEALKQRYAASCEEVKLPNKRVIRF